MNLIRNFFIYALIGSVSCNNGRAVKIISKYSNGRTEETHTYNNTSDTLTYLDVKYHENGKMLYHGNFQSGKQEGPWVWYFSNGSLRDSATYHNGEFIGRRVHWDSLGHLTKLEIINGPCYDCCCDGVVISYYPNGTKESETNLHQGKEHGKYLYYYNNGQPKKEQYFINGVKDGNYHEWFSNGKQWVTGFFKNGKMDSVWTWFDSTGKVSLRQELKNGELVRDIK